MPGFCRNLSLALTTASRLGPWEHPSNNPSSVLSATHWSAEHVQFPLCSRSASLLFPPRDTQTSQAPCPGCSPWPVPPPRWLLLQTGIHTLPCLHPPGQKVMQGSSLLSLPHAVPLF